MNCLDVIYSMKDKTKQTISYYDTNADVFFTDTVNADMSYCMDRFLSHVGDGRKYILDAGCGSGRDSKAFKDQGYMVDAFDASEEMCKRASEYAGMDVRCLTFEEFNETSKYDGIWACASLLHVEKNRLSEAVMNLKKALKVQGIMYASFKYGNQERGKDGRFFTDMNEESIRKLFEDAGLHVLEVFMTGDVRDGRESQQWVNVIAEK